MLSRSSKIAQSSHTGLNKDFLSTNLVDDEGEERVVDLNLDGGDVQLVHDIVGVQERQEPRQPFNEETFD